MNGLAGRTRNRDAGKHRVGFPFLNPPPPRLPNERRVLEAAVRTRERDMIGGQQLRVEIPGEEPFFVRVRNRDPDRAAHIAREGLNLPANATVIASPLSNAAVMDCPFDTVCSPRGEAAR